MIYKRLLENPLDLDTWTVFYDYLQDALYALYTKKSSRNLPLTFDDCIKKLNAIKYIVEKKKFPLRLSLTTNSAGDLFPLHLIFPEIKEEETFLYWGLYNNETPNLLCHNNYLFNTPEKQLDRGDTNKAFDRTKNSFDQPLCIENKSFEGLSFFRENPEVVEWEDPNYRVLSKIPIEEYMIPRTPGPRGNGGERREDYYGVHCRYCEKGYFFTLDVDAPDKPSTKVIENGATVNVSGYGGNLVFSSTESPKDQILPFKNITNLEEILDNLKDVGYLVYESSPGGYWIITDLIVSSDDINAFRVTNTPLSNWGDTMYQKVAVRSGAYVLRAFPKLPPSAEADAPVFLPQEIKYKRGNKYLHEFRKAFNAFWYTFQQGYKSP